MLGEIMDVTVVKCIGGQNEMLYFPSVCVRRITSALQDKTALENNSAVSVRISDPAAGQVSPGDKLFLREIQGEIPYSEALTVTSVRYNLRGSKSVSHIRLICS